jgi:hypothetical protein
MPHGRNVESTADAQALRHMRQMHREHQDVRYAFITFMLEMVLGEPKGIEPQRIHRLRNGLRLLEHGSQLLIGVAALVGGCRILTHVGEIDVTGIDCNELGDHYFALSLRALLQGPICHRVLRSASLVNQARA